ncbi:hypothetical protein SAMN05216268_116141 [Streptomyces yunnanensis]|uniref:Uncharacterized protein n=2 Tax=Streptomyces TaxID=1883 RepID=A0A2N8PHK1_STRNR|nr:hypothetical protein AOB60_06305 [Streptomyces noursei]SHM93340.1 hypothetical protein SAMN05216268_116141 [Streptomyces yunnanensis]
MLLVLFRSRTGSRPLAPGLTFFNSLPRYTGPSNRQATMRPLSALVEHMDFRTRPYVICVQRQN